MREHPNYRVATGGLMRCCLQSLDDEMRRRQLAGRMLAPDGDELKCQNCRAGMHVESGVWEWNGPDGPDGRGDDEQ